MTEKADNLLFELREVSKSFGKVEVLHELNLGIETGRTTVIIGPSGCGKTVLIKHLIGLIRPDKGEVFFDGMRIDKFSEEELIAVRRRCGFLFQAGALFDSETVAQNVSFPLLLHTDCSESEIARLVREKLGLVGLSHTEDRLPSELSGGQRKRVALARAIALSPEVILYDEPTTGLDPIRAETINKLIIKLQHDMKITSIVVTHDMNSAYKIADRIVMLSRGVIIAEGTGQEIRNSPDERVQGFIQGQSERMNGENEAEGAEAEGAEAEGAKD
jgi:phospholipid/cholesterol/gamma-HCH transport system ATP-binding protein